MRKGGQVMFGVAMNIRCADAGAPSEAGGVTQLDCL